LNDKGNFQKGFTLIEVLVSIVILVIVLTGVFPLIIQSSIFANKNKEEITATSLAQEALTTIQTAYELDKENVDRNIKEKLRLNDDWTYEDYPDFTLQYIIADDKDMPHLQGLNLSLVRVSIKSSTDPGSETYGYIKKAGNK
jgi:prepilin-type N-terminal cleavage/methylation domain-containing protein